MLIVLTMSDELSANTGFHSMNGFNGAILKQ